MLATSICQAQTNDANAEPSSRSVTNDPIVVAPDNGPTIYNEDNRNIVVTRGQPKFAIQLKSNPTTGYTWELQPYNPNIVVLMDHRFLKNTSGLIGAPGIEQWTFITKNAAFKSKRGLTLQFSYVRKWENTPGTPVEFNVTLK